VVEGTGLAVAAKRATTTIPIVVTNAGGLQVTAPLGQYDSTKLLNVGTNRWSIKPELRANSLLARWFSVACSPPRCWRYLDGPQYIYLSLDIDVLDPAFAPGTDTPEPPSLTNRELLPAIRRICHETPVVGMEVVEVAPHLDPTDYVTTMNARRAIFEGLT